MKPPQSKEFAVLDGKLTAAWRASIKGDNADPNVHRVAREEIFLSTTGSAVRDTPGANFIADSTEYGPDQSVLVRQVKIGTRDTALTWDWLASGQVNCFSGNSAVDCNTLRGQWSNLFASDAALSKCLTTLSEIPRGGSPPPAMREMTLLGQFDQCKAQGSPAPAAQAAPPPQSAGELLSRPQDVNFNSD